jgi:dihydrofolate reductase
MSAMRLHLIFARTKSGVIGKDNALPWHLPEDLAHFKRTTLGCPVIMGRKTWDSLPPKFRPLPGRTNVVVTRQPDWTGTDATGTRHALRADSLEQAMQLCGEAPDVWVIGGAQLYALALPMASTAVVTEIDLETQGDAFAPLFDEQWHESSRINHVAANGLHYRFITMQRGA